MEYTIQVSTEMTKEYVLNNYTSFTFPDFRKKIHIVPVNNPLLAILVKDQEKIAGLAITEFDKKNDYSEIVSFYVTPEYRQNGITSLLLLNIEKQLSEAGYKDILLYFRSSWQYFEVVNHLLQKHNWVPPKELMIIIRSEIKLLQNMDWSGKANLSNEFCISLWSELDVEAKKDLHTRLASLQNFPKMLWPFQHEGRIEKTCSLAIMHNKKVIGWNICYRIDNSTVEYNNLFVFPEYRKDNLGQTLVHESLKLQAQHDIPNISGIIDLHNQAMVNWFKEKMGPYASALVKVYLAHKKI